MGERRGTHRALMGISERKRPLGEPRSRWEDNIKVDPHDLVCGGGKDRIDLARDRDRWRAALYAVMDLRFS